MLSAHGLRTQIACRPIDTCIQILVGVDNQFGLVDRFPCLPDFAIEVRRAIRGEVAVCGHSFRDAS